MAASTPVEKPDVYTRLTTWFADAGLYQALTLNRADVGLLTGLITAYPRGFRVDCYCPKCRDATVFSCPIDTNLLELAARREKVGDNGAVLRWYVERLRQIIFSCARHDVHTLQIFLDVMVVEGKDGVAALKLSKIGQLPSKLDLLSNDLTSYKKVADPIDLKELHSAVLSHANGFHIAAFAYLRRVFERRLEIAHNRARENPAWDDGNYDRRTMRMEERIKALGDYLPKFLLDNRSIYGILSKGIHELTEEECEEAYAALDVGVRFILDEELQARERAGRLAGATKSIQALAQKYGKTPTVSDT
jgi:hypothetical protein